MTSKKDFKKVGNCWLDSSMNSLETGYTALLFNQIRVAQIIKIDNDPFDSLENRIIGNLKHVSLPSLGDIDMWYGTRKKEGRFPCYFMLKNGKYYDSISSNFAFTRHDKAGNIIDMTELSY